MRPILGLCVILLMSLGGPARAADTAPNWDNPRKLVLQLDSADPAKITMIFNDAINTQAYYGDDNVKIAIVLFGPGVHAVLKGDSPVPERVASLVYQHIELVACGLTLAALHKTADDLLPGVATASAGVPELIERQLKGWVYVAP